MSAMTWVGWWLSGVAARPKGSKIASPWNRPIMRWTPFASAMASISASRGWTGFMPSAFTRDSSMQAA
jgi:hypothetical protein